MTYVDKLYDVVRVRKLLEVSHRVNVCGEIRPRSIAEASVELRSEKAYARNYNDR